MPVKRFQRDFYLTVFHRLAGQDASAQNNIIFFGAISVLNMGFEILGLAHFIGGFFDYLNKFPNLPFKRSPALFFKLSPRPDPKMFFKPSASTFPPMKVLIFC